MFGVLQYILAQKQHVQRTFVRTFFGVLRYVFAQKQHVLRTFVSTFTTHLHSGPTPPHSRLSDPELLQQLLLSSSLHLQHLLLSPHYPPLANLSLPTQAESISYDPNQVTDLNQVTVVGYILYVSNDTVSLCCSKPWCLKCHSHILDS